MWAVDIAQALEAADTVAAARTAALDNHIGSGAAAGTAAVVADTAAADKAADMPVDIEEAARIAAVPAGRAADKTAGMAAENTVVDTEEPDTEAAGKAPAADTAAAGKAVGAFANWVMPAVVEAFRKRECRLTATAAEPVAG